MGRVGRGVTLAVGSKSKFNVREMRLVLYDQVSREREPEDGQSRDTRAVQLATFGGGYAISLCDRY